MVDLDELDRLHASLKSGQIEAVIVGQAREVVTLLRDYPALAAEVRALRAKMAERDAEIEALREVVASARCTVLAENVSRDDLRRELDMLRAALAKVPR